MNEFKSYAAKIVAEKPAKTVIKQNGAAHQSVYHWRADGSYITGCVRRNDGSFKFEIVKTDFMPG